MNKSRYRINFPFSKQLSKLALSNSKRTLFIDYSEIYLIKISGNKDTLQVVCKDQTLIVELHFKDEIILYRCLAKHNFLQVKPFIIANLNLCHEFNYYNNVKSITFKHSKLVITNPSLKMITKNQGINIFCGIKKLKEQESDLHIRKPDTKYFYSVPG